MQNLNIFVNETNKILKKVHRRFIQLNHRLSETQSKSLISRSSDQRWSDEREVDQKQG